jgi:hypothetical protein
MITGKKCYGVVMTNQDDDIVAIWGPFPDENEARQWPGIPGTDARCEVYAVLSPPQWFESMDVNDPNENEVHRDE